MSNYDDCQNGSSSAPSPPPPPPPAPATSQLSSSVLSRRQLSTGEDHSKRSLPSSSIYRQTSANSSQPPPQNFSESPLPPWFNDLIEHGFNGLLSIVTKNLSKEEEEEEKDEKEEKDVVSTTEEGDDGQAFGGNRGCASSLKESDDPHDQESPNRGHLIGKPPSFLSLSLSLSLINCALTW